MKKTAIENAMKEANILTSKETTFVKYTDDLLELQDMVVPIVMGDDYIPGMRIDEAIARMQNMARVKGLIGEPTVIRGINSLRTVSKEIHICMAGRQGENLVARTLEFISRPEAKIHRNVYITDGKEETEIDNVVVTDSGVIILEVKKIKDDITITRDGRLTHSGDECYEKRPLGEKMGIKRRLLKEKLDLESARRGFSTPVKVDSYIVFVTPKGVRINVVDEYKEEKWSFRTSINHRIDSYTSDNYYQEGQVRLINEVIEGLEKNKKLFILDIDYADVMKSFAEAMDCLAPDSTYEKEKNEWAHKVRNVAREFKSSPAGKAIMTAAPYIIMEVAGPAVGLIGKVAPRTAPFATKVVKGISFAASKMPRA